MCVEITTASRKRIAYVWREYMQYGSDVPAHCFSDASYPEGYNTEWLASVYYSPSSDRWIWNANKAGFHSPYHIRDKAARGKGETKSLAQAKRACERVLS